MMRRQRGGRFQVIVRGKEAGLVRQPPYPGITVAAWTGTQMIIHGMRQADDFWQCALLAASAYVRAAADWAGVPVREACKELAERSRQRPH